MVPQSKIRKTLGFKEYSQMDLHLLSYKNTNETWNPNLKKSLVHLLSYKPKYKTFRHTHINNFYLII